MSRILSRQDFRIYVRGLHGETFAGPDSSLWATEKYQGHRPSRWFAVVKPIPDISFKHDGEFWTWCRANCLGQVLCYLSGDEEWWGFTRRADIAWWLLRWA